MNNTTLILEASAFAVLRHHGQVRGGGRNIPYVSHCFDVARRLSVVGYDEPHVLAAAILHDVVEDTDTTLEELRVLFGGPVAQLVRCLTLPKDLPKHPNRIAAKLEFQMEAMRDMSDEGRAIKIADKTSNIADLRISPPKWSPEAILGYTEDAERVVNVAANLLPTARIKKLIDTFDENLLALREKSC